MNEKEKLVLETIKDNPFLSQQEMAETLNMSRPTLANIISGLIKKGEIVGRAYVLPNKDTIIAIGGANVDRKFHIQGRVQHGTSNPASVTESVGGVARNIAENLGRLGNRVKLLTTVGYDQDWEAIYQASKEYIELDLVEKMNQYQTGSYSAVLNEDGELVLAMANMAIYDKLLPSVLKKHEAILANSKGIIVDLNCPKETVEYLQALACRRTIPFAIIPVSSPKIKNMPKDLIGVTYFICNRDEAETYLNTKFIQYSDYENAVKQLLAKGIKNVVLTLGEQGVITGTSKGIQQYKAEQIDAVTDVTGAGDAFVGAFLHGVFTGESVEDSTQFGLYNAAKTLQSDKTVRTDLTSEEFTYWRK